jgi:hypothetical protein
MAFIETDLTTGNTLPTFDELNRVAGRRVLELLAQKDRPVAFSRYLRTMVQLGVPSESAVDVFYDLGYDMTPEVDASVVFPDEPRPVSWVD